MSNTLECIIEAALLAWGKPIRSTKIQAMFDKEAEPNTADIKQAIANLQQKYQNGGVELVEVASGWRFQVRADFSPWVAKLWQEKPPRYGKAFLETLALIAYRQPITRGEIEDIRGVAVSSNITKSMLEREWICVLGQKDVPGKPAMYGTTKNFLDYFNLKSLTDLPKLQTLQNMGFDEQPAHTKDNHLAQDASQDTTELDVNTKSPLTNSAPDAFQ